MTDAIEKRLAALERENAALKSQIAALQVLAPAPKVMPLPATPVRISYPMSKVSLPTEQEFGPLLEIVLSRYPQLRPRDTQGFEADFRLVFQFLQHTGRREKLDRDHGLLFWTDTAAAWLREKKIAPGVLGIGAMAFVAAAVASGDILYTSPDEFPHIAFGLVPYGGGIASKDYWRRALSGTILEALPPLHSTARPTPARIVRG